MIRVNTACNIALAISAAASAILFFTLFNKAKTDNKQDLLNTFNLRIKILLYEQTKKLIRLYDENKNKIEGMELEEFYKRFHENTISLFGIEEIKKIALDLLPNTANKLTEDEQLLIFQYITILEDFLKDFDELKKKCEKKLNEKPEERTIPSEWSEIIERSRDNTQQWINKMDVHNSAFSKLRDIKF